MMNKINTQEKIEGASSDEIKSKIEFAIDLDQRKRANLDQTSKSRKRKSIDYISKARLTGKTSEKSALQFERDEGVILGLETKCGESCSAESGVKNREMGRQWQVVAWLWRSANNDLGSRVKRTRTETRIYR
jgi:hypothetical protein